MPLPIIQIPLPEYQVTTKPDFQAIGAKIDQYLITHFLEQKLVIRCIGSQEHPGKTTDQLIQIIQELGTDRYDPDRPGDRYDNIEKKVTHQYAGRPDKKKDGFVFREPQNKTAALKGIIKII